MSFWPFTNSMNSNNALLKFLDSAQDLSSITAEDLIGDPTLLEELLNELHNIKGNYNSRNGVASFLFLQPQTINEATVSNSIQHHLHRLVMISTLATQRIAGEGSF